VVSSHDTLIKHRPDARASEAAMASAVEEPLSADQPAATAQDAENQENKDPAQEEEGSLRKMFVEGAKSIATHRSGTELQLINTVLGRFAGFSLPGVPMAVDPASLGQVASLARQCCLAVPDVQIRQPVPAAGEHHANRGAAEDYRTAGKSLLAFRSKRGCRALRAYQ